MKARVDYYTQEQLEAHTRLFKQHFEVLEISKVYQEAGEQKKKVYLKYNMKKR